MKLEKGNRSAMVKEFPGMKDPKRDRRMIRARLIRDGMSWRQACLRSGYSPSVADRGPRGYIDGGDGHRRPGVAKDFERAAAEVVWKPEQLRKIVTHRLATAVIEGRPSNVAREAELLGKMKEVDLFVRNVDAQVGVFAVLLDPEARPLIDAADAAISCYRD
jgi:hypothetical protein